MTKLNWLQWKSNTLKDPFAITDDGSNYIVSTYHHGTEIIVTGDDAKGNNILYEKVSSVDAGKSRAEKFEAARHS